VPGALADDRGPVRDPSKLGLPVRDRTAGTATFFCPACAEREIGDGWRLVEAWSRRVRRVPSSGGDSNAYRE